MIDVILMLKPDFEKLKSQCPLNSAIELKSYLGVRIEVFDTQEELTAREIQLSMTKQKVAVFA